MTIGSHRPQGPEARRAHPQGRQDRSPRRRLQVDRRPGLGQEGQRAALHRHPEQPRREVVREGRREGLPQAERLHRQGQVQGLRAGRQRPRLRQGRQPHPLPARRPPRRPARQGRQVRDARRQVHGQAAQQPQRPRLRARTATCTSPTRRTACPKSDEGPRRRNSTSRASTGSTPKGELTLLTKEMTRPNGIGLSPDEKTLYVANSDPDKAIWMAFPIKADGTLGAGQADPRRDRRREGQPEAGPARRPEGGPKGNIFATGSDGVYVFAPDDTLPRQDRDRRQDRQLRLGRRRHRAVHLRQRQAHPRQDDDEGPGVLSSRFTAEARGGTRVDRSRHSTSRYLCRLCDDLCASVP